MAEDNEQYIPDDNEDKKHYTLAEAYELLRKQEQEDEHRSGSVSEVRDC